MAGDVVPEVGATVRFREPGGDVVREGVFLRVEQRIGIDSFPRPAEPMLRALGPPVWHLMVGEEHWQIRSTWVVDD